MDTDQLASNEDYRELRCPSLTCKKFLAITDRLRRKFSAFGNELYRNNCEALYRGIERFPNLEELELYRLYDDDDDDAKASGEADIDTPIVKIASSGLNIRSLTLQNLPKAPSPSSVRELGSTMRNLKRLICCDIKFLGDVHIVFIADELQCLEELGIIFCNSGSRCCRTQYPQLSDRFVTDAGIEISMSSFSSRRRQMIVMTAALVMSDAAWRGNLRFLYGGWR